LQTVSLPDNYSYSSIFSFLLPPCSYVFFFVTCFLFLFFPRLATPFSLLLASSSNFLSLFYITLPFLLPPFSFLFFLSSTFAFRYLCIFLLSLFYLLNSFPFVSSLRILLVFLLSAAYLCSSISRTHTHTHIPRTDVNFCIKVLPILKTLFAE
jgi:hypothetical protein